MSSSSGHPSRVCFFVRFGEIYHITVNHQWMLCSEWVPSEWVSKQLIYHNNPHHSSPSDNILEVKSCVFVSFWLKYIFLSKNLSWWNKLIHLVGLSCGVHFLQTVIFEWTAPLSVSDLTLKFPAGSHQCFRSLIFTVCVLHSVQTCFSLDSTCRRRVTFITHIMTETEAWASYSSWTRPEHTLPVRSWRRLWVSFFMETYDAWHLKVWVNLEYNIYN